MYVIINKYIKELLKIFTPDEVADYLELIRVKLQENAKAKAQDSDDENEFLESIIDTINTTETAKKNVEAEAHEDHAVLNHAVSEDETLNVSNVQSDSANACDADNEAKDAKNGVGKDNEDDEDEDGYVYTSDEKGEVFHMSISSAKRKVVEKLFENFGLTLENAVNIFSRWFAF